MGSEQPNAAGSYSLMYLSIPILFVALAATYLGNAWIIPAGVLGLVVMFGGMLFDKFWRWLLK